LGDAAVASCLAERPQEREPATVGSCTSSNLKINPNFQWLKF